MIRWTGPSCTRRPGWANHTKGSTGPRAQRDPLQCSLLHPLVVELNPVDGMWSHLKRSLANLTKHSLDQLTALVKTRLKLMQYRPRLIEGLITKTGLDFPPPSAVKNL